MLSWLSGKMLDYNWDRKGSIPGNVNTFFCQIGNCVKNSSWDRWIRRMLLGWCKILMSYLVLRIKDMIGRSTSVLAALWSDNCTLFCCLIKSMSLRVSLLFCWFRLTKSEMRRKDAWFKKHNFVNNFFVGVSNFSHCYPVQTVVPETADFVTISVTYKQTLYNVP